MKSNVFSVILCSAGLLCATPSVTWAQVVSTSKPVRFIVPFAAGGAQDAIGRYFAHKLTTRAGMTVVVENKGGAGGVIAADQVAKSTPDGTTLLIATGSPITIAPHLQPKLPYDPKRDFVPLAILADTPMTLAVRSQSRYTTMAELIRDAKTRSAPLSFASNGTGTISHLVGELFAQRVGVPILPVPYRGAGPAMTDLMGGQVEVMVASSASIDPAVKMGTARVLGSFTAKRLPTLGGAPTVNESAGMSGLEVPVWVGVMAPAKTPAARIAHLTQELQAICKLPETQEMFLGLGALPSCGGPADLEKVVAEDFDRWSRVIRQSNIKVN
ncbi:Bug family tripartite tricarboxylate transporter substrate binding protein [Ottowia thiooxydans]|uniref:Bug family tripartite tricarboxylate transporter substrate binding protein n=1 Tax=Ottowia thiooxydans TaxID=219182 RepID=UPI0003FC2D4C|nr:tripartite tricarboxylate transporter substrate binding protein [Ottowia thiooxydans]